MSCDGEERGERIEQPSLVLTGFLAGCGRGGDWPGPPGVGSEAGRAAEDGRIAGRKNQLHSSRPGLAVTTARIFPSFRKEILDISGSGCFNAKC